MNCIFGKAKAKNMSHCFFCAGVSVYVQCQQLQQKADRQTCAVLQKPQTFGGSISAERNWTHSQPFLRLPASFARSDKLPGHFSFQYRPLHHLATVFWLISQYLVLTQWAIALVNSSLTNKHMSWKSCLLSNMYFLSPRRLGRKKPPMHYFLWWTL